MQKGEPNTKQVYVTFFKVAKARDKQIKIIELAYHHFMRAHPILFFSQDQSALDYVSWLLWSFSKNDFLPHTRELSNEKGLIYLSDELPQTPRITSIFNLSATPIMTDQVANLYEFDDTSTPEKGLLAKKRYNYYLSKNFALQLQ